MTTRINRLIDGLQIIQAYSNDVYAVNKQIVAGPVMQFKIPEEDQKLLEELDWFFEENEGWTFYLG